MDAGADPLGPARPDEVEEKPKPAENQDDGYETSNSGEAARRKPSSAEGSPAPPPAPPYDPSPLMRYAEPEPPEYRAFDPPPEYQHFPFPKYSEPYGGFKREAGADMPFDMSQHHAHAHAPLHAHAHAPLHAHAHAPPPLAYKREDDYNGIKRECDDPYSFVEEDPMCNLMQPQPPLHPHHHQHHQHQHHPHAQHHQQHHPHMMHQQMIMNQPKKRGRKKKIKDENGMEIKVEPGMEGALVPRVVKERKKHDRFNGMSEEEVSRRTLPDHLGENLDIIIIGINPGLFAAYKGHHYAGPGNHFWKCLYLSGLTREQMSADEDYKLLNFGIGFTNMVCRATKGSADLTRREIKEGSAALLDKLQAYRPKVAVFNGKLIYEVFSGKKDFCFGKQPDTIAGTNTYMWVMPSSSARCAQLPRAADKVPFYAALKKFRDYLNGLLPHLDEGELVFPDTTSRRPQEEMEIRRLTTEPEPGDTIILEDGTEVPLKKKRGRPKKVKLENGEVAPPTPRAPRAPRPPASLDPASDQPPKKKRGRPKKIRPEEQQFLLQQQQQQQQTSTMLQPLPSMSESQGYLGGGGAGGDYPQQLPSPLLYHQQMNDNATYFQPQPHQTNPGMESPLDVSSLGLSRGYSSPGAGGGAGYAASPRGVYASPRSQGYSPSPARTPQPQYPASPAAFSAPSPPLRGGTAGAGGAGPGAGSGGGGGTAGQGGYGSPAGRFAARSPLYAHSPASYHHAQQASPARYSQSPHPHHPHPYSRSPVPQVDPQSVSRAYSRSPLPPALPAPPAASPGGGGGYAPSPYSHHSSPAPPLPPTTPYSDSHHHLQGGSGSNASSAGSNLCADLSSDIGAAISSPPPAGADFEPPKHSPASLHDTSDMPDYSKSSSGRSLSPGSGVGAGGSFGGALFEAEARLQYSEPAPTHDHYSQDGTGVSQSPRLDQMHQHAMYPTNFNRRGGLLARRGLPHAHAAPTLTAQPLRYSRLPRRLQRCGEDEITRRGLQVPLGAGVARGPDPVHRGRPGRGGRRGGRGGRGRGRAGGPRAGARAAGVRTCTLRPLRVQRDALLQQRIRRSVRGVRRRLGGRRGRDAARARLPLRVAVRGRLRRRALLPRALQRALLLAPAAGAPPAVPVGASSAGAAQERRAQRRRVRGAGRALRAVGRLRRVLLVATGRALRRAPLDAPPGS